MGNAGKEDVPLWRRKLQVGVAEEDPVMAKVREVEAYFKECAAQRQAECFGMSVDMLESARPVMSGAHEDMLRAMRRPAVKGVVSQLDGMFGSGESEARREYLSTKKVVESRSEYAGPLLSTTSNVVEALDVPCDSGDGGEASSAPRARKYEVVQLLTDASLLRKFPMSGSFKQSMRMLAVVDCVKAAVKLQEHVRGFEGSEKATVSPGKYAASWKAAKDRFVLEAAKYPLGQVIVEALFVGDKVFMYGPDDGDSRWSVIAPERCASLARLVYKMVLATSCESVSFAYGSELTVLGIDVFDGQEVVCPIVKYHSGLHDEWRPETKGLMGRRLSVGQRQVLAELCSSLETVAVDGENCATAVRVSDSAVLVCGHIAREEGVKRLAGEEHPLAFERMLSRDLWIARSSGPQVAWMLRKPVMGELVFLAARRNEELVYSDPVEVLKADAETLVLRQTPFMAPGASGAAIIAVEDFAMLGVYDGVTLRSAVAAAFTPEMYTAVVTAAVSEVGSREDAGEACELSRKLKDRGLSKLVSASSAALVPLYDSGEHVGHGVASGGRVHTLCDPNLSVLALESGQPLVFDPGCDGYHVSREACVPQRVGPKVVRSPAYAEGVFVVGRDAEGIYYGMADSKVVHVGLGASKFTISHSDEGALPLKGGLVVSKIDGAVVGVFDTVFVDRKHRRVAMCKAMPRVEAVEPPGGQSAVEALAELFPFLNPSLWPEGSAEGALTHVSAESATISSRMLELAMVGDSAMRTKAVSALVGGGMTSGDKQKVVSEDQCNAAQAAKCEQLGLSKLVVTGPHLTLGPGSKVHADVLEAVAGLVYLYDRPESFDLFCLATGMVRKSYGDG